MEGAEELRTDGEDTGTGGNQTMGLGDVIQCSGTGGSSIRVRDVGDDPLHGNPPGKFPEQVHQADYGEASEATGGWELVVTTAGDRDGGGGF